jgi:hypothetical protein
MATWYEVFYSNNTNALQFGGAFKNEKEAIQKAEVFKKSIVYKLTKVVLNFADGWTDVETVYNTTI